MCMNSDYVDQLMTKSEIADQCIQYSSLVNTFV